MGLNKKLILIVLGILFVIVTVSFVFVTFSSSEPGLDGILKAAGFESSSENSESGPAVPLPSEYGSSGSGSSSGGPGGSRGSNPNSSGNEEQVLRFCTFDAFHVINGETPCRCGFVSVCYESGKICDATFNNGEGLCS